LQFSLQTASPETSGYTLVYYYEIWTLKERGTERLRAAEMKFMRLTAGHNLMGHRRNEDILKELQVDRDEE
jgi:hypothetical protein